MVHAVVLDVPAPVEMYDAMHAELLQHDVTSIDGLILHLGRSTAEGNLQGLVTPHAPVALGPPPGRGGGVGPGLGTEPPCLTPGFGRPIEECSTRTDRTWFRAPEHIA